MANKKNISVCLTTNQFEKYADGKSTVVVVDLLRATSVISIAFECGVSTIIPVRTLEEARKYKAVENHIIAAERNTLPIEGFDYGNSPYHYINADVKGKTLVLTTTNGTNAILLAKEHKVITASFVNIDAVAKYLIEVAIVLIFDVTASLVCTPKSICNPPCKSRPSETFFPLSVCKNEGIANTTPNIILSINIISL